MADRNSKSFDRNGHSMTCKNSLNEVDLPPGFQYNTTQVSNSEPFSRRTDRSTYYEYSRSSLKHTNGSGFQLATFFLKTSPLKQLGKQ